MRPPSSSHPTAARLLICGFSAFPGFPENPAQAVIERLERQNWRAPEVQTDYAVLPTTWAGAVEIAAERMRTGQASAVLLVGVAGGADALRVEMRAQNRAATTRPDADGEFHPRERISPEGPASVRSAAPIEAMVRAIGAQGLPAHASSDAGDYLCNYTFYRLQTEIAVTVGAPPVAFLHLPPVSDTAAQNGPGLSLDDLERGVKAAASALAANLADIHQPMEA